MIAIAGGILIAAAIIAALCVGASMIQVDHVAGWTVVVITLAVAVWVIL